MKKSTITRLLLVAALIGLVGWIVIQFDPGQYLQLDVLKTKNAELNAWKENNLALALGGFFVLYVVITSLALPGAAVLTLAAGALFGLVYGTILVSFASSIGATLCFMASRFLFGHWVQRKFQQRLKAIYEGVERDGKLYLFGLRLVPVFPFFVINVVMSMTPIKPWTFYWVSQLGMLAGTVVYVNAGTQLASIQAISDVLTLPLLLSFALLAVFPLCAKAAMQVIVAQREAKRFGKPKSFSRNLIVIGAGSAGLVASYIAAAVKAKVTLIEGHQMGGDCLNTGCVPSKALIRTAQLMHEIQNSHRFGIQSAEATLDFAQVMERVARVIKTIEPHDSVERYQNLGVEVIEGQAKLISPYEVEVNNMRLSAPKIVIATGARPFIPPIKGLDTLDYLTSDTVWNLRTQPESMVVLGGGPIGCELAQCFARLGIKVYLVEWAERLLIREDPEVSELILERMRQDGVHVMLGHKAEAVESLEDQKMLVLRDSSGTESKLELDTLLIAVGRTANSDIAGIESLKVQKHPNGCFKVNEYLQLEGFVSLYACGDVAGPYQFTHTASHQAWFATVNALFGALKRFRVDYSVIPWATFTDPAVSRVGLNEQEANEQGIAFEVTRYELNDLDRAIADGHDYGFVKVLTVPNKDKILGATIVGHHSEALITEFITAMRHGLGLNKILGTIHIYPTMSEANRFVAGQWKRDHVSARVMKWLERYHHWMRS